MYIAEDAGLDRAELYWRKLNLKSKLESKIIDF
jgi:hypothetical protein